MADDGDLQTVLDKIDAVCKKTNLTFKPRLVGAAKTQPKEKVIAVYEQGLRDFGENYIQELYEKGTDPEVLEKCKDIRWHFIGSIQRNKVAKLLSVPKLDVVETIASERTAAAVNEGWKKLNKSEPLKVMVQVNTSREAEKGGVEPEGASKLVKFVLDGCPVLKFIGLMTIGKYGYDPNEGPNPDFLALKSCREKVCTDHGLNPDDVELSMGMSTDYEQAIELGSTNVRVGEAIFGKRTKKLPKVELDD